jgi:hypothetical protein
LRKEKSKRKTKFQKKQWRSIPSTLLRIKLCRHHGIKKPPLVESGGDETLPD